jgi:3-hydroxybutyryl-CoA dehydratase
VSAHPAAPAAFQSLDGITPAELFATRFEDLRVGYQFETRGRTVTEADVVNFAAWTGDRAPMHTDRHWTEKHWIHSELIAHGLLVLSYTVGLLPLHPDRVIALRRIRDVVFKRPTFLGDTLHARGRIDGLRRYEQFGCVITQLESVNQRDEVVARGNFELLWRLDDLSTDPANEERPR